MYLLGYDIGSSSVKASLVDAQTGSCLASAFYPKSEAPIIAVRPGWAEQDPSSWWEYLKAATADVMKASAADPSDIRAIGISYQMHGLVCIDGYNGYSGIVQTVYMTDLATGEEFDMGYYELEKIYNANGRRYMVLGE